MSKSISEKLYCSNCGKDCFYKQEPEGGFCYMWAKEPENCYYWKKPYAEVKRRVEG